MEEIRQIGRDITDLNNNYAEKLYRDVSTENLSLRMMIARRKDSIFGVNKEEKEREEKVRMKRERRLRAREGIK